MAGQFTVGMRMQRLFFDKTAVSNRLGRELTKRLNRGGFLIRQQARKLLGSPSKKAYPRPVGQPPRVHSSDERITLRNIQYHSDGFTSVVTGPVRLNQVNQQDDGSSVPVPQLLEQGGSVNIHERSRDGGKTWRRRDLRFNPRPGDLFRTRRATYGPRPFMAPALEKVRPKVPYLFAASSTGAAA